MGRKLSVEQFLKEYPISRTTLYKEIKIGNIPHFRLGGRIIIDEEMFLKQAREQMTLVSNEG
jgi:hypothetical protein